MITEVSLVIICHHYRIAIFLAIRALKRNIYAVYTHQGETNNKQT